MLEIKNLHAKVDGELVLKGVNLSCLLYTSDAADE